MARFWSAAAAGILVGRPLAAPDRRQRGMGEHLALIDDYRVDLVDPVGHIDQTGS
jgi:hypothetical protein